MPSRSQAVDRGSLRAHSKRGDSADPRRCGQPEVLVWVGFRPEPGFNCESAGWSIGKHLSPYSQVVTAQYQANLLFSESAFCKDPYETGPVLPHAFSFVAGKDALGLSVPRYIIGVRITNVVPEPSNTYVFHPDVFRQKLNFVRHQRVGHFSNIVTHTHHASCGRDGLYFFRNQLHRWMRAYVTSKVLVSGNNRVFSDFRHVEHAVD